MFRFFAAAALAATPVFAFAAGQDCKFDKPSDWGAARAVWFGPCRAGHADGLGVLRAYVDGKPGQAFFGRLTDGAPAIGVMETDGGFAAGKFSNGRAQDAGDRQTLIDAFRTGADAARAASAQFKQQKNSASARFYADKADQLARQMD